MCVGKSSADPKNARIPNIMIIESHAIDLIDVVKNIHVYEDLF